MRRYQTMFMVLLVLGCIDPYTFELEEGDQLVIVDGFITTERKSHIIQLARSDTYGNIFEGIVRPFARASVYIRDNTGNITYLHELGDDGRYATPPDFAAVVGNSYTIHFQLADGRKYSSIPEKILPAPPIDSLTFQPAEFPSDNPLLPSTGVQIVTHFKDPADEKNFYQWLPGNSVYVFITNPELHEVRGTPMPLECCSRCYRWEFNTRPDIQIADDINFNGNSTRVPSIFIEDNGLRFKETFRAEVRQLAITEKAYRFLLLAKQQLDSEGNIFDPPPANIRSNIINDDDPDETVLGYFYGADVSHKFIYIKSSELEFHKNSIVRNDCRVFYPSFTYPPDDWNP